MSLPSAEANMPAVSTWNIVMLFLCAYVLGALFADTAFSLPEETSALLTYIDNLVCIIFIGDFLCRVISAENKWAYMKWGWVDLLSSIPFIQVLRWGRFVRVFRILRVMRGVRSTRHIMGFLFANRAKGALTCVSIMSFVLVVFAAVAILNFETSADSNIATASDALWWAFVTITTVGYGDHFPVSHMGRLIAASLMVAGVALFGTFTAFVASLFMQHQEDDSTDSAILKELSSINHRLTKLESAIKEEQERQDETGTGY